MASVTQAEQSKKPSVPTKKVAPSQYQVETGQAVHAGEMAAAQAEGGKKGAMTGLGVGSTLGAAALSAKAAGLGTAAQAGLALSGPLGWGILAAGLGATALAGWAIGSEGAKKPERERQKDDAKQGDIAALSGQAQDANQAKLAKEQRASATRAGRKPQTASTFTDDEQLVQATSISGANPSQDAWHAGVYGSGRSV